MVERRDEPENQEGREKEVEEVAKRMLIEGYARKNIVEEVKEATGLTGQRIGSIRGNLAREGAIPTKAQMRRMEREKPGPEALKFQEEQEGVPFRRPRPPYVLIESILTQFGVKEKAKEIIIRRCKRAGGMHPSELDRSLMDLDTGVNRKEASYVTEEYYLALQAEEDAARQAEGRSWPMRRREPGGAGRFPLREDRQPTDRQWDYNRSLGRPGDRSERGREEPLTTRSLYDILERRERDLEDRMRRSTLEDKMGSIGEDISVLATELRNLKDNPPVVQPPGESDYEKTLQHTIERLDERGKEQRERSDKDRAEAKTDLKEQREYYEGLIDKQDARFKEDLDKRGTPYDTSGYKDDSIRLAAEGFHEIADVLRSRGSPARIIIEGAKTLVGDGELPPQRERGRPASVADLVGPDYVER